MKKGGVIVSRIRYKKDLYTIDVIYENGKLRVIVDGLERTLYVRIQTVTGNPSYIVYVPNKGHNKQLTISKAIIEAVKEGVDIGNE